MQTMEAELRQLRRELQVNLTSKILVKPTEFFLSSLDWLLILEVDFFFIVPHFPQDSSRKRRASGETTGSTPAPSESAASVATIDQNGGLNEDHERPPSAVVTEDANPSEKPEKQTEKPNNGDEGGKEGEGSSTAMDER